MIPRVCAVGEPRYERVESINARSSLVMGTLVVGRSLRNEAALGLRLDEGVDGGEEATFDLEDFEAFDHVDLVEGLKSTMSSQPDLSSTMCGSDCFELSAGPRET